MVVVAQPALAAPRTIAAAWNPDSHGDLTQIAYSARTDAVWVLNASQRSITILSGASGDVLASIPTSSAPQTCAIDDASGLAYVPLIDDELWILDSRTYNVVKRLALPPGSQPRNLLPLFKQQRVYVLNYRTAGSGLRGDISVLDTSSGEIVDTISAGYGPYNGKTGHDRLGKIYFNNREAESELHAPEVTVVDDASDEVIARIEVGRVPERIAHWPQRNAIYTANLADNSVSAIDIATDRVVATIPVGPAPVRLGAVESINGRDELWVLSGGYDQLQRIPPQTQGGQIWVISGRDQRATGIIEVCDLPAFWAVHNGVCYVPSASAREMVLVDIRVGAVVASVKLDHHPVRPRFEGIVWSTSGALFLCNADNTVSVFAPA